MPTNNNNMQLQPVYANMPYDELLAAVQSNFRVLIDAYVNGANAIFFRGQDGANGIAGQRGASMLYINRTAMQACYNAIYNDNNFEATYSDSVLLCGLLNTAIGYQGTTPSAAFTALCQPISEVVSVKEDFVMYDVIYTDNGKMFRLRISNEAYQFEIVDTSILTSGNFEDTILQMIQQNITGALEYWVREQSDTGGNVYYSKKLNNSILPINATQSTTDFVTSLAFLAIGAVNYNEDSQYIVFVGNAKQMNDFYSNLTNIADDTKKPPIIEKAPAMLVAMRSIDDYATDDILPDFDGLVLAEAARTGGTLGDWNTKIANIVYNNGKLWLTVNKALHTLTQRQDLSGTIVLSNTLFKATVAGAYIALRTDGLHVSDLYFDEQTYRNVMVLGTDANGKVIPQTGSFANPVPVGSIIMWPSNTLPNNDWMLCDGQSLSTTDYAALYAVIGTTFGGGRGTFTLPDFRGRFPIGVSRVGSLVPTGRFPAALAEYDNSYTRSIDIANLPNHSHSLNSHTHQIQPHKHGLGNHVHSLNNHNHSLNGHTHTLNITSQSSGSHTHVMSGTIANKGLYYQNVNAHVGTAGGTYSSTIRVGVVDGGYSGTAFNHNHTISITCQSGGGHTHTVSGTTNSATGNTGNATGNTGYPNPATTDNSDVLATLGASGNTGTAGSSQPFNVMPPYLSINFIIKVKHTAS